MARTKATAARAMFRRGSNYRCVVDNFWQGKDLEIESCIIASSHLGPLPGVAVGGADVNPSLSETYGWTHEQVLKYFQGLGDALLVELVVKEKLSGRAMHTLLSRRELFTQRFPAVPLGDVARLEAALEDLCENHDAIISIQCGRSLWLATGGKANADEMLWHKHVEDRTVFDRLVVSYDEGESSSIHRRHVELRFARCVGVSKNVEDGAVTVAFRSSHLVLHHFNFDVETQILGGVQHFPAEAHYVVHGQKIQTFSYDVYNFSWKPHLHSIMPRQLRLALRELFLIRRFRPDHALARFDKHLLFYLFSFVAGNLKLPVSLSQDGIAAVTAAQKRNQQIKSFGQWKFESSSGFQDVAGTEALVKEVPGLQFEYRPGVNTYTIGEDVVKFGE